MIKRSLFSTTVASFLLVGCGSGGFPNLGELGAPLEGSFNPLDPPGRRKKAIALAEESSLYEEGALLETVHPSSPLFHNVPKGNDQPFAVLTQGQVLKVLGSEGLYVRVQTENGQLGFIPDAMVAPQSLLVSEEVGELIPEDLTLNPDGVPTVAPDPEIPSIEPPLIIDPSAGNYVAPIPEVPDIPESPSSPSTPFIPPEPELPSIE